MFGNLSQMSTSDIFMQRHDAEWQAQQSRQHIESLEAQVRSLQDTLEARAAALADAERAAEVLRTQVELCGPSRYDALKSLGGTMLCFQAIWRCFLHLSDAVVKHKCHRMLRPMCRTIIMHLCVHASATVLNDEQVISSFASVQNCISMNVMALCMQGFLSYSENKPFHQISCLSGQQLQVCHF
jgi:hypothetical protein